MPCRCRKSSSGLTLIELILVSALIALIFAVVAGGLKRWGRSDLRKAANRLSVTIQYLRDKAATENLYIKLVFKMGPEGTAQSYYAVGRKEPFLLIPPELKEEMEDEIEVEIEDIKIGGEEGEEIEYVERYKPEEEEFGALGDNLLKTVTIPKGVVINDIWTSHNKEPVSDGEEFIAFFPNGTIEPSIINLRNSADTLNCSIEIDPLIGTTKIEKNYKEMPK